MKIVQFIHKVTQTNKQTNNNTNKQSILLIFSFSYNVSEVVISRSVQPFPKRQILDAFKLKEFAYDNFKFIENGRKLFKQAVNTVKKGAISPFPSVFKRFVLQTRKNQGLFGKGLNTYLFANRLSSVCNLLKSNIMICICIQLGGGGGFTGLPDKQ